MLNIAIIFKESINYTLNNTTKKEIKDLNITEQDYVILEILKDIFSVFSKLFLKLQK